VSRHRVLVVGGGHNGLVAACYLARGGADVLVLEQSDRLGGGSRTDEVIPGHLFDTHSAAHNIVQATGIVEDLQLGEAGLEYREMDPFSVAVFRDGPMVRFSRSVEATVASIAEVDAVEAGRYAAWMRDATPVVTAMRAAFDGGGAAARARQVAAAARALARNGGPLGLAQLLLSPYGKLLGQRLGGDLVRGPVAAFAAHASAAPDTPGSAVFALWQAFYHQVGQWHAVGGSQGLVDALATRLAALGGRWRTGAAVGRIVRDVDRVTAVELEDGERLPADAVLAAVDPRVALLDLLDPPLDGDEAARLRSVTRGNAVQMLVHLATDALPAYPAARPGDWNGLQSYVDSVDALSDGFAQANAGRLPEDPVPAYAFTPSALDDSLAPPGRHTVYLACPTAPHRLRGGWAVAVEDFADRMVAQVEARAPGFTASVTARSVRTPETMAAELRWPGAHPMYADLALDQLGPFRPTRALARSRTPVGGLFLAGAGVAPVGGIAGVSGRAAAGRVLRTLR
jgi:phytoene dehydrogenase-like protein